MYMVEDFELRSLKVVSSVVRREKEIQEWNKQKLPKVLPGFNGGRLPGRSTKEKGRDEGEVDEDSGERRIRSRSRSGCSHQIKERASVHDGIKEAVQRPVGQSFMRSWECSQLENEEEEESWREGDQTARGDLGAKKDGRKLLEVGGHAKGTGASGA